MGYKVDSLELDVKVATKGTGKELGEIIESLKAIKNESKDLSGFEKLKNELRDLATVNLTPLASALGKVAWAAGKPLDQFKKITNEIDNSKNNIFDMAKVDMFGEWEDIGGSELTNLRELTDATYENADAWVEAKSAKEAAQEAVTDSREADKLVETSKQVQELTEKTLSAKEAAELAEKEFGEFYNRLQSGDLNGEEVYDLKNALDAVSTSTLRAKLDIKSLATDIKDRLTGSLSGFSKIAKRFTKYSVYRGIRAAFNAITKSFTEGLSEAYRWSNEAINGYTGLSESLDNLQSEIGEMRRQLGAVAGELLRSFTPVINYLLDGVTAVANQLTQFFAALSGESTYMKSVKIAEPWEETEEATKGASKALKDYKQQLLGIDELNVLTTDKDNAGATLAEEKVESGYELAGIDKESIGATLGIGIKDFFFDFGNLSLGQQFLDGLGIALGGILGFRLGGVGGALVGATLGLSLGVFVGDAFFSKEKSKFAPKTVAADTAAAITSAIAGAGIGFSVGGFMGGITGLLLGLGVSLAISELTVSDEEIAMDNYFKSDFKQRLDEFKKTKIDPITEVALELKTKVEGIDLSLSSDDVKQLEMAQKLIIDIFELDEKDYKTPKELDALKTKIEVLNGLKLPGIELTFNDLTGKVVESKDAVEDLIAAMLNQAKVEAGLEKYKELMGDVVTAEYNAALAEQTRAEALDFVRESELKVLGAQAERAQAEREMQSLIDYAAEYTGEYTEALELNAEKMAALQKRADRAALKELEFANAVKDAKDKVAEIDNDIAILNETKAEATRKSEALMGIINKERKAINKDATAISNANGSLNDFVTTESGFIGNNPKVTDATKSLENGFKNVRDRISEAISKLGTFDEKLGKTDRSVKVEFEGGGEFKLENASDAAIIAASKGMKGYANGGFVEGGHLFFANENGNPEYIGNMNGNTAVANSDQMSKAIEEAAYAGFVRALQQSGGTSGNEWQPMSGDELYMFLKRKSGSNSKRTGMGYAF